MGTFHRYRTAWSRLHRSSGFGVHSPFAYKFITCVLRERLPYYAYAELRTLRRGWYFAENPHSGAITKSTASHKSAILFFCRNILHNPEWTL